MHRHTPKPALFFDFDNTLTAGDVLDQVIETFSPNEAWRDWENAWEDGQLSAQEYRSIRDSIWNNARPVSELKRVLVEQFPAPESKGPSSAAQLKRLAAWARKLASELHGNRKVPRAVAERADALAEEVEELALNKAEA